MRWLWFWSSALVALVAFGAWRTTTADYQEALRGQELATRQHEMPYKLPLAGINVELTQYENPDEELEKIAALGFIWLRQSFLWTEIEPEQGVFDWSAYDKIVEAVATLDGQLKLVAVLDGTPAWARHPNAPDHPFAPPASPADYGAFARAVADRYGDTIDFYQIWDEPNIEEHWGNLNPRPALYVTMLEAAYTNIHAADEGAMVIAAALAPNVETGPHNINDPDYLRAIYELGGRDFFDAAAGKPYGFDAPPDDRALSLEHFNFSRLILLREVMLEYGDGAKPLWGSNFGWNALPENWENAPSIWGQVNVSVRSDYTKAAFQRAQTEWAWLGGLILYHWQPPAPPDDPIQGFAVTPDAENWQTVVPRPTIMTSGLYPAVNPYTVYAGDWQFSDLGADGGTNAEQNTITVTFDGTEFALLLRRGDYLAYLEVTIDGQPANALPQRPDGTAFITLTAPQRQPVINLILAAEGLAPGQHTAVITQRPAFGDDQYPIVGFAVGTAPDASRAPARLALVLMVLALLSAGVAGWRLPWQQVRLPSPSSLRNIGDFLLGLFFSTVLMIGGVLTWQDTLSDALKRDLPTLLVTLSTSTLLFFAPSTWIALIGLLITGVIIFNRPWVGILQVIFWSAFFTSKLDPFFRALAMVEVLLALTLAATLARLLYDHAKQTVSLWERLKTIKLHPLDLCMIGFVLLGAVALTWVEFLPEGRREWRVMLLQPTLFYMTIRLLKPNPRELAFMVETMLVTGFLLSAIGLVTYFSDSNVVIAEGGTRRLISIYGSPNALSLMLGRYLPFALAYLLLPVSQWRKYLAAITGLTMLLALLLTQSVGGILLGAPTAFVIVVWGWRGRRALPYLGGVIVAGIIALLILAQFLPRLRQIANFDNNTTLFRLNLWRSTAQLLEDHPLTGVGPDQFLYAYRSRYILPEAWEDPNLSHPHNVVLDYWVRLGILGVGLGLASQWFFWRGGWRVYQQVKRQEALGWALILGTMGAMGAFLAHGLVDMAHFNINLSYVFALLLVLTVQLEEVFPK